jgi:hypothetical protein
MIASKWSATCSALRRGASSRSSKVHVGPEDRLWPLHLRRHAYHADIDPAQHGRPIWLEAGPNPLGLIQTHSCPMKRSPQEVVRVGIYHGCSLRPVSMPDRGDETWS